MGCASSKGKVCRNCKARYSPVRRSYSLQKSGDIHHVVSLTSSTLGSLRLDPLIQHNHEKKENGEAAPVINQGFESGEDNDDDARAKEEFATGMIEVKSWSKMIDEKIPKIVPKTPIRTPPGEPEMIDALEMMEGLEDINPVTPIVHHFRSFSFQIPTRSNFLSTNDDHPTPRLKENVDDCNLNSNSNSNPISTTLESRTDTDEIINYKIAPRTDKLIVYFTSLRGVRKTFEDCCHVRVMLKGLGIKIDERDVSMHSGFKEELKELLGDGFGKRPLPIIFIGKKCIGGADEIRRLNEEGELRKTFEHCELVDDGIVDANRISCQACGDIRFIPCETCSGSCKIYYEGDYDHNEEEFDECGFKRCPDCNENGLVRCPLCLD